MNHDTIIFKDEILSELYNSFDPPPFPHRNRTTFLIPKLFSENKPQFVPNIFSSLK